MKKDIPHIPPGKRAVVVGRTGSGKSSLAGFLLRQSPQQWIILNPKGTKAYDNLPDIITVHGLDWRKLERAMFEKGRDKKARWKFINLIPSTVEANFETMDNFLLALHESYTGIGFAADELYTLNQNGRAGPGLTGWLTRGRELKQSFMGLTQRPAWVSKFIFSEADYIGEMSLVIAEDQKRMYEVTGKELMRQNVPQYEWLWYDVGNDRLRHFNPLPIA